MNKGFKSKLHLLSLERLNMLAKTLIPEQGAIPLWIEPLRERDKIPARWMLLFEVRHAPGNSEPDDKHRYSYLFEPAVGMCQSYTAKTYGKTWAAYASEPFVQMCKLLITEENVDGCSDYAQAMVGLDRELSPHELDLFCELLHEVKSQAAREDKCLDTDDMIQETLDRFKDTACGHLVQIADCFISF